MRSHEKKRYYDGLIMIKELCSKLTATEVDYIFEVLSDCQQYIIALGNELENESHKEDVASLIPKLESFAERMYIASEGDFSGNCAQMLVNEAQDIIDLLEMVPCRKEVVFLPYKASMWDAFDSVYQAAVQDENANVVVMPIPYRSFDKKTGGWNEHYERELFPESIQITDYKAYDLDTMKPDFVFIHNPYDQYNYVTRVHEEFFSSNLVNYTDHLVYIPYDVVLGSKIDDNYCKMPGVRNAWRVIVQSESIREDYIKWVNPEKVLALGSPKIDAVVNYTVDWSQLPDEWKEKCENKKVFLYNTHLNGIISDGYLLIKRLQNVWEYFQEHQEITLLWRPHPLSVQTAEAMNPDFLKSYLQMVEKFKKLSNCIYDNTPDLNRAMGISDAYMGDYSSLVMLYGFMGKPMLLHSHINKDMREVERNSLLCHGGLVYKEKIWMACDLFNGLFSVDMKTKDISFISEIYGEEKNKENLFATIIQYKNDLILIPHVAKGIVRYNLLSGKQDRIEIINKSSYSILFSAKIQIEDKLYLFPLKYPNSGIILDLNSFTCQSFEVGYEMIGNEIDLYNDWIFGESALVLDGKIMVPLLNVGKVVCYECDSMRMSILPISDELSGIKRMYYKDQFFWFVERGGDVFFQWNQTQGIVSRIAPYNTIADARNSKIEHLIFGEGYIWIIPSLGSKVLKCSRKKNETKEIYDCKSDERGFQSYPQHYNDVYDDVNTLYLFPFRMGNIVMIDKKTDAVTTISNDLSKKYDEQWKVDYIYAEREKGVVDGISQFYYYDSTCTLEQFNSIVCDKEYTNGNNQIIEHQKLVENGQGNAGKAIFEYIWDYIKGENPRENK